MFNLNEILNFECQNEHVLEHDLQMTKNFSTPKIYNAKGDLSKRWYIYFSFRNPETGKLERITPFYGEAHKYKTKEDQLYVLNVHRKKILELKDLLNTSYYDTLINKIVFYSEQLNNLICTN